YEDLVLLEQGDAVVRLGDVATVREGFEDADVRGRFNGQAAVVAQVFKTPEEDSLSIAEAVRQYVASREGGLPEAIHLAVWGDGSLEIASRISVLTSNGLQGLVLLFLTMWVFLEFRLAFWVAAGIPVSFAGSLLLMDYLGQTINMVSLFALIMVTGIIVDDSIVIAESVHTRRQAGDSPQLAAIEGTSRVALPVLGSTLTTIVAFLPLMYVVGVMGRFVYVLPVVVIAALLASTVEGMLIQPAHLCYGQKTGKAYAAHRPNRLRVFIDRAVDHAILRWYHPLHLLLLRNRGATLAVTGCILLLTFGAWAGGRTPFVLLPTEDGNMLRARVRYPEGTPASVAQATIERLERAAWALNDDPSLPPANPGKLVRQVYSIAGEFSDFLPLHGSNLCDVRIELMPSELREVSDDLIIERWREHIGTLYDATEFTIVRQEFGPPGMPIEIRVLGDDLERMAAAAERIEERVREFDGVTEVHNDLIPGKRQLRVTLRPAAQALGLTLEDVATQLRNGFFGGEAVRIQRDQEEVKVRVRYPEDERRSIADLENLRITASSGQRIPFLEAANVEWGRGYANIMHQDGKRRVRVLADIDERRGNADTIVRTLEAGVLDSVLADFDGLTHDFGGDRERINESFTSLRDGFALALLANYALLALILGSYAKPLVVIAAIPFGLAGGLFAHLLFGLDITMMSLFGLVGAAGLVVNESLVLVDAINGLIREGRGVWDAVVEAGTSRFRPIFLTSITDLAGLSPILISSSAQTQSVRPMAIALSFGLLASALFNLLVVPCVYLLVNDGRRVVHWLRQGGPFPAREAVENEASADHEAQPAAAETT
ncbi:MAG: efflux RND transporter permease subunit, partial [Planctomycetota bacterium]